MGNQYKNSDIPLRQSLPSEYEYCPNCEANLTLQKGYRDDLPYWVCKGCGEMLINPELEGDIIWQCDGCGDLLNIQPGFSEESGEWVCTKCGFVNNVTEEALYLSEEEYEEEQRNPYRGLTDEQIMELSVYTEVNSIGGKNGVVIVKNREDGMLYVMKHLVEYNLSIYSFLKGHPIEHMPKIIDFYEGSNCLIIIEEYIEGNTLSDILKEGPLKRKEALRIAKGICDILCELHELPTPIIHRDIKPSNIIVSSDKEVVLLDMNVAKWYDADKTDDTKYMGTQYYAAPEQLGYGFSSSSAKTDIYALGMLINNMFTGRFPKEQKAEGDIWPIIERCISLEASDRYAANELKTELDRIDGGGYES